MMIMTNLLASRGVRANLNILLLFGQIIKYHN